LDIVSKNIAVQYLTNDPKKIIGSLLQLRIAYNSGAAFSLAPTATLFFSLFSISIAAATLYLSRNLVSKPWAYVAGLVLGGICGNLLDRIFRSPGAFRGPVVDWIELPHWPTFNFADSSIFIAAILACILTLRNIPPTSNKPTTTQTKED
jgi:signal peptidase II